MLQNSAIVTKQPECQGWSCARKTLVIIFNHLAEFLVEDDSRLTRLAGYGAL
jgi:hypothetical protein